MSELIKISNKTEINKAAGAVAHFLRADKEVCVTGTGRFGQLKALHTVTLARRFVLEDGGFDVNVRPDFIKITHGEDQLNGIEFHIVACKDKSTEEL